MRIIVFLLFLFASALSYAQNTGDFVVYYIKPTQYSDNVGQSWAPFLQATQPSGDTISGFVFPHPDGLIPAGGLGYVPKCPTENYAETVGECWQTVNQANLWGENVTILDDFITKNDTASMMSNALKHYRSKAVKIHYNTDIDNLPSTFAPSAHNHAPGEIISAPWATVDKGTVTLSGTVLQTQYTVTHGLGYTPTNILLQAKTNSAAEKSFVDNYTSTTFRVTFVTVPILGTNNIVLDWYSFR